MYISGSQFDFENRLHHVGFTTGVLYSFNVEAVSNYTGVLDSVKRKWDKEYKNRLEDWSASLFDSVTPVETFYYLRPDGTSLYFRPDGTSLYLSS